MAIRQVLVTVSAGILAACFMLVILPDCNTGGHGDPGNGCPGNSIYGFILDGTATDLVGAGLTFEGGRYAEGTVFKSIGDAACKS